MKNKEENKQERFISYCILSTMIMEEGDCLKEELNKRDKGERALFYNILNTEKNLNLAIRRAIDYFKKKGIYEEYERIIEGNQQLYEKILKISSVEDLIKVEKFVDSLND
jgi:hypothetical protein